MQTIAINFIASQTAYMRAAAAISVPDDFNELHIEQIRKQLEQIQIDWDDGTESLDPSGWEMQDPTFNETLEPPQYILTPDGKIVALEQKGTD